MTTAIHCAWCNECCDSCRCCCKQDVQHTPPPLSSLSSILPPSLEFLFIVCNIGQIVCLSLLAIVLLPLCGEMQHVIHTLATTHIRHLVALAVLLHQPSSACCLTKWTTCLYCHPTLDLDVDMNRNVSQSKCKYDPVDHFHVTPSKGTWWTARLWLVSRFNWKGTSFTTIIIILEAWTLKWRRSVGLLSPKCL